MATKIDPKTLFSTPNHCVTSFSLWNIRWIPKLFCQMTDKRCFLICLTVSSRTNQPISCFTTGVLTFHDKSRGGAF